MEEPEVMAIVISIRLWLADVIAEKCSAALPTIGRMMRPTKKGFNPIWCVSGSIVLTSTSLTTAVIAVAPARTAIGSQRVVLHQAASVASRLVDAVCRRVVASTTGAVARIGSRFTIACSPAVNAEGEDESSWDA